MAQANKTLEVSEMMTARLEAEYPALDVRQQIRYMQTWWEMNPRKRKTPKGEYRFVVGWLNRAYAYVAASQARTKLQAKAGADTQKVGCWVDGKFCTD